MTKIDVRPAAERFHTRAGWLDSNHSFSFARHHDPDNTHHGLLLVSNDDRVRAGTGFSTHPHRDMEIVTWVLSGRLEHKDSEGNHGEIYPGLAQRMSAGRGIYHSEMNPSADEDVHFIQMWVLPDEKGYDPGYQEGSVTTDLAGGGLVKVASGHGDSAIHINQRDAALYVARLAPSGSTEVPDGAHVHVFVAVGDADLEQAGPLHAGDAVRLTAAGQRRITAGAKGAEVIVWATA